MFFSAHVLAGAAAATLTVNPAVAFLAGLASHAVLDAIPHKDYGRLGWGVADFILGMGLGLAILARGPQNLGWGAFGGGLPDLEVALAYFGLLPAGRQYFLSHSGITPHGRAASPWGVLTQVAIAGAALWVLVRGGIAG